MVRLTSEQFHEQRRQWNQAEADQIKSYEQAMLALTASTLALSVSFWEKITEHPQRWTFWILIAAWASLFLSVISITLSFLMSHEQARDLRRNLDRGYNPRHCCHTPRWRQRIKFCVAKLFGWWNPFGDFVHALNYASLACFALGVALILVFAGINLSEENHDVRARAAAHAADAGFQGAQPLSASSAAAPKARVGRSP